jgi:hypothetical protein
MTTRIKTEDVKRRVAEIRHWFFQTLVPEQRSGFFEAWAGVPKGLNLTLGTQYQTLERIAREALSATPIERLREENARLEWLGSDTRLSLEHYSPVYCDDAARAALTPSADDDK